MLGHALCFLAFLFNIFKWLPSVYKKKRDTNNSAPVKHAQATNVVQISSILNILWLICMDAYFNHTFPDMLKHYSSFCNFKMINWCRHKLFFGNINWLCPLYTSLFRNIYKDTSKIKILLHQIKCHAKVCGQQQIIYRRAVCTIYYLRFILSISKLQKVCKLTLDCF